MISSFLRVFFFGVASLLLSWAPFLFLPSSSESWISSEAAWFSEAFPPSSKERGEREGVSPELGAALSHLLPGGSEVVPSLQKVLRHRSGAVTRFLPVTLLAFTTSFLTALLVRERLRFGTGYASPTVSFLAKRTAEFAVLVFFLLTFSPFPLPYWACYPALGALVLGTFGYVSNLPLRL